MRHPLPFPQVTSGSVWRGTDIHTDGRDHYTFRIVYDSTRNVIMQTGIYVAGVLLMWDICTVLCWNTLCICCVFVCVDGVERLLASQNPLSHADRPHQLFADAPPVAGAPLPVPMMAPPPPPGQPVNIPPPGMMPPPLNVPPPTCMFCCFLQFTFCASPFSEGVV